MTSFGTKDEILNAKGQSDHVAARVATIRQARPNRAGEARS